MSKARAARKPRGKSKATSPEAAPAARVDGQGYVQVQHEGKWVAQHRVIAEAAMGRPLVAGECVHHINEDTQDNRPGNLLVFASGRHHRAYHEAKPTPIVWDGRAAPVPVPTSKPKGRAVAVRILKTEPVKWRELAWFQGDLKLLSLPALEQLKSSIRDHGIIRGFRVWEDNKGTVWILDGHQMRRALAELQEEGLGLPELVPGTFMQCRDKAEAAALVLLFSAQYGELRPDHVGHFAQEMGLDLEGLLANLQIPHIDLESVARKHQSPGGLVEEADRILRDQRPAAGFAELRIHEPALVARVVAWLNREGIEHTIQEATG